ncbi:MAG: 50S ribosomal protein L6 [Candidatus Levybacteria bacterium CG_4_10_14_0_2_um_filter_36_16]|nr:MAG: 50S ribosomal protein L6 [Candidatus Levybacteria bacterium CG2_30_37_29]PIR79304.1 MAG: 50S ribosomal protein L6 [Candidatus Levybacteria bacterium CG10_big_fil_rev_8_21_14_0_10_36_30]PIZ97117.1 MAG: 50S ribosomal protein L6 [Candidatus Levybacteria bacterium CG_4_10_14_0_2_um_filter_36_16]PJA90212.1 MAG: 50S ribosomal protein L6 [Candidatus Levybacteria bacterium CG_4_9_14_3_um_filter_36_7]
MSHIGKKIITLPENVQIKIENGRAIVTGVKGTLESKIPAGIKIEIEDKDVSVKKEIDNRIISQKHGLIRALIANMVEGVSKGFEKKLELSGVGYRARIDGGDLILNVGFANPVQIKPLEGTQITVVENAIIVAGIDKQRVGDMAADIRKVRVPDVYKGKGIKYAGEKLRKKAGKAAKAVGAK